MANCPSCGAHESHWIQGAIKHPGALTQAASRHGVSKLSEAEHEAHSSNPHIAARGRLGERFINGHGKP